MSQELYVLKEVLPHIYHLSFENRYQCALHFLRVQEFYESPKFRGKIFTLVDYMEWYSKSQGEGCFTYPVDWSGFNVPSWVLASVYLSGAHIKDFNKYDEAMARVVLELDKSEWNNRGGTNRYYLIGTSKAGYKGDEDEAGVLDHELAHGLYFTDDGYKAGADKLISETPPEERKAIHDILIKMGYADNVLDDELQAYCSTGLTKEMESKVSLAAVEKFTSFFKKVKAEKLGEVNA